MEARVPLVNQGKEKAAPAAHLMLESLVAGGGFEPPTFGL